MVSYVPSEIGWLVRQIRPLFALHVANFLCITAGSVLALLNPLILKWLIDQILPRRQPGLLLAAVALIFLSYAGRMALLSLGGWLTLHATQKLALDLRNRVLRHLDTLSAGHHESTPIGASMYPLKEPIDEIAAFGSDLVPSILRMLVAVAFTLGAMLLLNARTTLAVLPVIPVFLVTRAYFRRQIQNASNTVQADRISWSNFLQEHISAIIPIQLLRRERHQERQAFRFLANIARSQQRLFRAGVVFTMSTGLTVALAMAAVIGYGGYSVLTGHLTVGGLVAFYSYLFQLFDPLSGAVEMYTRTQKAFGSIRQVQATLALLPTMRDSPGAVAFPDGGRWEIECTAMNFAYGAEATLSIPSLHIFPGELLAVTGANGAGKSTLAKLLVRLYDADAGTISIGGVDIRRIRLESLRRNVCFLPQYPAIFDGTLATNLRVAKPTALMAELEEVMKHVGLGNWLNHLPKGFDHRVGPGGSRLSAGQRQRIGIARVILQRPRIAVLDEAASCLDASSERTLLPALGELMPGSTVIVISHRLSTISSLERIVVLDGGRIVADGSPSVVLRSCGVCSRLFHASPAASG